MSFLKVADISRQKDELHVLHQISFHQKQHQHFAIAGETGSGKTTLLKIIAGVEQSDGGQVFFQDQRVLRPNEKLLPGHPAIGFLSQHFELRNYYRVEELLEMARRLPNDEAVRIFEVCQITHLLKRRSDQLSGGEKQRIATARLLIHSPKLLLLDEPFSNLDMVHKQAMKEVIESISEQLAITCIMVSHEPADILPWADEILVLKDGRIVQQGSPYQLYNRPKDEYTAGLLGKYNLLTKQQAEALRAAGASLPGDKIMLRPEHIILSNNGGVEAKVKAVHFFGRFYELQVYFAGSTLTVHAMENNVSRGDIVHLEIKQDSVSFL